MDAVQQATSKALSKIGREPKLVYSVDEVLQEIPIGRTTLYAEMKAGRLASVSVGRRRLIPRANLEAYVAGLQEQKTAS